MPYQPVDDGFAANLKAIADGIEQSMQRCDFEALAGFVDGR